MELTSKEHSIIAQKLIKKNITEEYRFAMRSIPEDMQNDDAWGREAELLSDDKKHWWYDDFNKSIELKNCVFRKHDKPSVKWLDSDVIAYQFRFDPDDPIESDSYIEVFIKITQFSPNKIKVTHILPYGNEQENKHWLFKYPLIQ